MLQIWLETCARFGIDEVLINVHAHAAAVQDFLLTRRHVEIPGTGRTLGDWDGKRPILCSDVESRRAIRLNHDTVHLFVAAQKGLRHVSVCDFVAAMQQVVRCFAKKSGERCFVIRFYRGIER